MNFKPTKRKITGAVSAALIIYITVVFLLRCFPLGCELWDWQQFILAAKYVAIPAFLLAYLIIALIEK